MNKYFQNLKIIVAIFAVLGLLFGPVFWYQSTQFYKEYDNLLQNGEKSLARIIGKTEKKQYRYQKYMVDIQMLTDDGEILKINGVSINALLFDNLKIGEQVSVLSNKERTILTANYQNENVPPIKKRYFGMRLTLIAGLCILILGFLKKVSVNNCTKNENS